MFIPPSPGAMRVAGLLCSEIPALPSKKPHPMVAASLELRE
jgi:hypothetical protein